MCCFVNLLNLAEQFISQVLLCTVDSEKWIPVLKTKSFKEESQEHLLLKQHLLSFCWVVPVWLTGYKLQLYNIKDDEEGGRDVD